MFTAVALLSPGLQESLLQEGLGSEGASWGRGLLHESGAQKGGQQEEL